MIITEAVHCGIITSLREKLALIEETCGARMNYLCGTFSISTKLK